MINVFYIEDHHVTVTGFRSLFRPSRNEIQLVGSAVSIDEAIATADPAAFDILLMDLWLDEKDPFMNIKKVMEHFNSTAIVMYSGETRIHFIKKAFQFGVKGFLYKSSSRDEILKTLVRVKNGETVYPEVLSKFLILDDKLPGRTQKTQLTERQRNILSFLCQGLTVKEIAEDKLFISISLVEKTLYILREMFMVRTNVELVTVFLQQEIEKPERKNTEQ